MVLGLLVMTALGQSRVAEDGVEVVCVEVGVGLGLSGVLVGVCGFQVHLKCVFVTARLLGVELLGLGEVVEVG